MELDRLVRGKRFDLSGMPTDEQQRCRTWIKRHPFVCEALRDHANVIRNLDAFFDAGEGFYWVIDEWIDGESLDRLLSSGREFSEAECRSILLDIASGLDALHQQNFIRREVTPANILLASSDRRAVLCEFELAKLIDRGPTVSGSEWPDDPYRAGEATLQMWTCGLTSTAGEELAFTWCWAAFPMQEKNRRHWMNLQFQQVSRKPFCKQPRRFARIDSRHLEKPSIE